MTLESPATLLLALSHLTAVIAIATRYGHTSYVRKLTTPHSAIIQLIIGALALSLEGTLGLSSGRYLCLPKRFDSADIVGVKIKIS